MTEKISEEHIRTGKVNKLVQKILKEIEEHHTRIRRDMTDYLNSGVEYGEKWEVLVADEFALLRLRSFITSPERFMSFEERDDVHDKVVYRVSIEDIDIWLQDSYDFVNEYLCRCEWSGDFTELPLSEYFFGYEFTNIFDKIAYEKHKRNLEV